MTKITNEQNTLAHLLVSPDLLNEHTITPMMFTDERNRDLFNLISDISSKKRYVLTGDIRKIDKELEEYAKELLQRIDTGKNFKDIAETLQDAHKSRLLVQASTDIAQIVKNEKKGTTALNKAIETLKTIVTDDNKIKIKTAYDVMLKTIDYLKTYEPSKNRAIQIPTGIHAVDNITGGYLAGLVTIVAARPSVGKSTFILNTVYNIASEGKKVLYVSIEDTAYYVSLRLLSRIAHVEYSKLSKHEKLSDIELAAIERAKEDPALKRIRIIDTGSQTADSVVRLAHTEYIKSEYDALFVDHLDEMTNESDIYKSASKNVKKLRDLAKELNIPLILVVQLNREVEKRSGVPKNSDLRDSGRIEEVARQIIFLHRQFLIDLTAMKQDKAPENEMGVFVTKNSHGRVGAAMLDADLKYMTIRS